MPLQKFTPKVGVNRENTRLFSEGGWWESDKVRFRQGTPEKIGGWERLSSSTFFGVCRSLWTWANLLGQVFTGVITNSKFYVRSGGSYTDITPARRYVTLTGPFVATTGSSVITVTDAAHGAVTGDFVTYYGASALSTQTFTVTIASPAVVTLTSALANGVRVQLATTGALPTGLTAGGLYYTVGVSGLTCNLANVPSGTAIDTTGAQSGVHSLTTVAGATAAVLNTSHEITVVDANTYTIDVGTVAPATDIATGGTVNTAYDIAAGFADAQSVSGWGASTYGSGPYGVGVTSATAIRLGTQSSFGQDLVFGYRGGALYYWNAVFGPTEFSATFTIAAPCVATLYEEVVNGTALAFLTAGALPTGLTFGTTYYVINASGFTCNLALTPGGAAINTSGTQSGTHTVSLRGLPVTALSGASDVPLAHNKLLVSDVSRFTICLGVNPLGETDIDPMFIRWSAQESVVNWTPAATNQAGGQRLSVGSKIVAALQSRQEILVFTDAALYAMQYLGPPYVWGFQLLGDGISIVSPNAPALLGGVTYWMGRDKFYKYDGRVQTLRCDIRRYIFDDINMAQADQFFAGSNEGFNEVWFFYCSASSDTIDRYATYNSVDDCWAYGTLARTAWIDSGLDNYPLAATYDNTLVFHEFGLDDNTSGTPQPIEAYILSSEFDIGDGHAFGFVWRVLPDITFQNSTAASPSVTMTLYTLQNSGSGYNTPGSVGGVNAVAVARSAQYPVEKFTGQINTRVRGRQLSMKVSSNQLGTTWQLGATRIDVRPDGRRGG